MKKGPKISKIEVHRFEYQIRDVGLEPVLRNPFYEPGSAVDNGAHAIRI